VCRSFCPSLCSKNFLDINIVSDSQKISWHHVSVSKHISKVSTFLLAGFLGTAGIAHFVVPKPFNDLIPEWLPGDASFYTYISGLAELAIAVGLVNSSTRKRAAWGAVVLFIAVYPGNLYMAYDWRDRELSQQLIAYGRLPFQIPLIWWAVTIARKSRATD
jgi:uncharacterized membrane protein